MAFSPLLEKLVSSLSCLPGVGRKTAQRMALHLLHRDREAARHLAEVLIEAVDQIGRCGVCRNFTEAQICEICGDERREVDQLCVVESPMDVLAIEQAGNYRGRYYVLFGHLSPIDGIGPEELAIDQLETLITDRNISEVILATNLTVEGEATAHYIASRARQLGAAVTRIAHGVPTGGELEYVDGQTLSYAIQGRKSY
jgi:recombination protein RecR